MRTKKQVYKVIKMYKASPTKRLNILGSIKVAMKDLTPLAFWLYQLFLFAEKEIQPSYAYICSLLNVSKEYAKKLVEELVVKGYVIIRNVENETHFIVYYDNLDSIITGAFKRKPEIEKFDYRKKYDLAYKRAIKSLEKKKKEIEKRINEKI